MLEADWARATTYIESVRARLAAQGVRATGECLRGEPTARILEAAERAHAGLIVFGTHGTVGSAAFWARSVPPSVTGRTWTPIPLVPVGEAWTAGKSRPARGIEQAGGCTAPEGRFGLPDPSDLPESVQANLARAPTNQGQPTSDHPSG